MTYHLRVFALGIPFVAMLAGIIYAGTLLPLWAVLVPLGLVATYCFGKAGEILLTLLYTS